MTRLLRTCSSRAAGAAPEAAGLPLTPGLSLRGLFALLWVPHFPPAPVFLPPVPLRGTNLPPRGLCRTRGSRARAGKFHRDASPESQRAPPPRPPLRDEAPGDQWGSPEGNKATGYPKCPRSRRSQHPEKLRGAARPPPRQRAGAAPPGRRYLAVCRRAPATAPATLCTRTCPGEWSSGRGGNTPAEKGRGKINDGHGQGGALGVTRNAGDRAVILPRRETGLSDSEPCPVVHAQRGKRARKTPSRNKNT